MRVMEIWQNKELTVIGPPVNTISDNPILVYSGSSHYYFGLLGLFIFKFDPTGSVFLNIVLILISIPFFFILSKDILKKKRLALISTFIYAVSPVTVAMARSYWNPNLAIPLSVFFWFLVLYKKSLSKYFLAGIIGGIIFNLHYMNSTAIAIYIILLMFRKDKKYFLFALLGFIVATFPLIAFELKNHFFLTKAFIGSLGGFSTFSEKSINPFLSIDTFLYVFGLGPPQYFFPGFINIAYVYRIVIDSIVGLAFAFYVLKNKRSLTLELVVWITLSLLAGWYFQKWNMVIIRWLLSAYPLIIIFLVAFISSFKSQLLLIPIVPMLILSTKIITHRLDPNVREDYYPVSTIEAVSRAIVLDNPTGKYNVTENILGDAQSLAFRYYLLRDAKVKPQPVERYDRIDTLYVITPSLNKTYKESRWEFLASGPKKIVWEENFGDLKLYKFIK